MAVAPTRLTETFVKSLQPTEKLYEVRDTQIKGFVVRVMPTGTKTFFLCYLFVKKKQTFKVGRHGSIKTQAAREIAERNMALVKIGCDIQQERIQERRNTELEKINTVEAFLEARYKPWLYSERPKSAKHSIDVIERHFSQLMKMQLPVCILRNNFFVH